MVSDESRRERAAKKTPAPPPERPPEPVLESEESELEEWDGGAPRRTISFYHAEGAPYLDDDGTPREQPPPEELEELRELEPLIPPTIVEEIVGAVVPIRDARTSAAVPVRAAGLRPGRIRTAPEESWRQESRQESTSVRALPSTRVKKPLDLTMVEEAAYIVIRKVFRDGVRIPIRREGVADLDVTIRGKEIVIDVNQLFFDTPKLSVWKITFAYQGEPLAEFGRGVKGDLKIHLLRAARFAIRAYLEKREYDKRLKRETG